MKPSYKSQGVEDLITSLTGIDRRKSIQNDCCVLCGKPANHFDDELSKREFQISGTCQECQNKIFAEGWVGTNWKH